MFIDVAAVGFFLTFQRGLWTFAQAPYPAPSVNPFLVVLLSFLLLCFAWSERVTTWFLEDDETEYDEHDKPIKRTKRAEWVTVPAVIILILVFFGGNTSGSASGSGRSHRQRPAPAPSPSVQTQQAPGLLFANDNAEPPATVVQDQPAEWKVWCCVVGSTLVGLRIVAWRLQKARLRKTRKEGNTYRPSNVHGAAVTPKRSRPGKQAGYEQAREAGLLGQKLPAKSLLPRRSAFDLDGSGGRGQRP